MGTAPWQHLGRYLRNSPIFQVDRVQTPLLIIQGDMDYVALQPGKGFYRARDRPEERRCRLNILIFPFPGRIVGIEVHQVIVFDPKGQVISG